ncbi:MAG: hypothetical protein R3D67_13100 [Hyphomicrobiaceae bacterium]
MKGLVALLVLLAGSKVLAQHYLTSTAKSEIIVQAYRQRAADACQRAARLQHIGQSNSWAKASDIRLVIGKRTIDVQLWQVDNALWQARFKNPYLILSTGEKPQAVFCEFDVVQGAASVYRL